MEWVLNCKLCNYCECYFVYDLRIILIVGYKKVFIVGMCLL